MSKKKQIPKQDPERVGAANPGASENKSLFYHLGKTYFRFWQVLIKRVGGFYRRRWSKRIERRSQLRLHTSRQFSKTFRVIRYGVYQCTSFFTDAFRVVKSGYRKRKKAAFPVRFFDALRAFFKGVRNNRGIFTACVNYALPVLALVGFLTLVRYVSGLNYAVNVSYNGEHVGYINDETVYEVAEAKLQERLVYKDGDQTFVNPPEFTVEVRGEEPLKNGSELTDVIIQNSQADIVQATGITIDDEFYGAVLDGTNIRGVLSDMLSAYKTEEADRTEFAKEVIVESGLYLKNNIVDEQGILDVIQGKVQGNVYYTIQNGDTPIRIASKNGISLDELVALNPNVLKDCVVGKQVMLSKEEPFLPVKTIVTKTYNAPVPYGTEYTTSANLYEGTQAVTRAGKDGEARVTAEIEYLDGIEIGRKVLESVTLIEPSNQIIAKGTMKMPVNPNYVGKASSYGFIWPVSGGYISQYFKGNAHNGIDYACPYGTPIYAALPGKVVHAGWQGSYGNLVILDHGNGNQTYYAHCSRIIVSYGQTVARGQQIANVGNTGRSFGNHLHFRVIIGGVQQDPLIYLPK